MTRPTKNRSNAEGPSLDQADAVAHAAQIWIRSLCMTELHSPDERQALAGGLIAGLCDRLSLDPRIRELIAYIYALLDDEGARALPVSRLMLEGADAAADRSAFEKGREEARAIAEMLAFDSGKP